MAAFSTVAEGHAEENLKNLSKFAFVQQRNGHSIEKQHWIIAIGVR